jgi:hypothetical protein
MAEQFKAKIGQSQVHQAKKLEIGWMGLIFGDAAEKPGNIAALAIVLSFLVLIILLFVPDSTALPKSQAVTLLAGIITGSLGFLFGRHSH